MTKQDRPRVLGDLKKSGWRSRPVKTEMRENLLALIERGETIFEGIVGYDHTVLPQVENALLSGHNFILLGLRGQAKTRIIRELYRLLDEFMPVIAGSPLNEDPLNPITPMGRSLIEKHGDATPIEWISREDRFNEKLATPDVSIADLIGDIDPIKAAREKLDISNEEVIHWGIIPRTNRGIFAINELPDLQPRIQVGLLNILEEADIQVRGFPLSVPLDMLLVFTANPEDYTNRGNIITPLKDRIDAQILTHYPRSLEQSRRITDNEAHLPNGEIRVPEFMRDIIEQIAFTARDSEYVDQSSGVSARVSISAYESVRANVERRARRLKDDDLWVRMCDLYAAVPAVSGKIELVYEGEQEGSTVVAANLVSEAINSHFLELFPRPTKGKQDPDKAPAGDPYEAVLDYFRSGRKLEIADDMPFEKYAASLRAVPGLEQIVREHFDCPDDRERLVRMEFVLEGLVGNNVLARETHDATVRYGDVFSDMLKGMGGIG